MAKGSVLKPSPLRDPLALCVTGITQTRRLVQLISLDGTERLSLHQDRIAIGVVAELLVAELTTSRVTTVLNGLQSTPERRYLLDPKEERKEVRARRGEAKVVSLVRDGVV